MKRFALLLSVLLLLLCGCGSDAGSQPTEPVPGVPEVTEPPTFSTHEANHAIESLTGHAVKRYQIEQQEYYGVCAMGEGIVLFSGEEDTTLTYVTRDNLPVSLLLEGSHVTPEDPSVRTWDSGISYYDSVAHALVFLDQDLKPSSKIVLSQEVPANPLLSEDGKRLYYYTEDALRCLDLRSGISRLLRESGARFQQAVDIHFNGRVLQCRVSEGEEQKTLMVSTENGETLFSSVTAPKLVTAGERFFAGWMESEQQLQLYGSSGGETRRLMPLWEGDWISFPDQNVAIGWRCDDRGTEFVRYDLEKDGVYAALRLPGVEAPVGILPDSQTGLLWLLCRGTADGTYRFYSWDPSLTPGQEEVVTQLPYYTADFPDTEGLARCEATVKTLSEQYGPSLRIWEDAVDAVPDGYHVISEYSVEVYDKYLPLLEKAMSAYPEEIYSRLSRMSNNGKLTVCLVREIYGSNELGSLTREEGVYYIKNGSAYLVLTLNSHIETTFYHELFHAMDSYIIMESKSYDEWNSLNPSGFSYDNSYLRNESRDPGNYLEEGSRAFIDVYSMSYPKEDRARIMEYAMVEGNEGYFTSEIMGQKLETLCKGIRKAFKLKDDERVFPWEQYLA